MSATVAGELAAFTRMLSRQGAPEEVRERARLLLLDFLGCAVGGRTSTEVRALTGPGQLGTGPGRARILGTSRTAGLTDAAFADGCAADAYEHQDGYRFGGFHPSHLVPALMALAESERVRLPELLTALIAGYEVADRIGEAMHPEATRRGWFPTAAAYGAAAAAARLAGCDADRIEQAVGMVAFHVPAVTLESIFAGVTGKPAFAGQIARTGAWAALAARDGLQGWSEVLEHPRGPIALASGRPRVLLNTRDLGERWSLMEVHQKRYAACRHTHAAAQACVELLREHGLSATDLDTVEVQVYDVAKALVDRPVRGVPTAAAATLSVQYVLATAARHAAVDGSHYTPEALADPGVLDLAARVRVTTAPDLQDLYPELTPARVSATTTGGAVLTHRVDLPAGDSRAPLDTAEVAAKFEAYTAPVVGGDASARAREMVLADQDVPVTDVIDALTLRGGASEEEQ